jgi:hypothetical protein
MRLAVATLADCAPFVNHVLHGIPDRRDPHLASRATAPFFVVPTPAADWALVESS